MHFIATYPYAVDSDRLSAIDLERPDRRGQRHAAFFEKNTDGSVNILSLFRIALGIDCIDGRRLSSRRPRSNIVEDPSMIAIATILLIALADAGMAASAMTATGSLDNSLMPRRTVLVFAPVDAQATDTQAIDIPEIDALRAIILANDCAIEDRDLDIFIDGIDAIDGLGPGASSLAEKSPEDLRSVYAVDERRFEMVLIGKDGGIKARGEKPEDLMGFLALIDTMPMRRAEIAERGRGCAWKRKTRPKRPAPR